MNLKLNIEAEGQPFIVPISAEYTAEIEKQINKALNHFLGSIASKINSILTDLVFAAIGVRRDFNRVEIANDSLISKLLKDKATELVDGLDLRSECVLTDEIREAIRKRFIAEVNSAIRRTIYTSAHKKVDDIMVQLISEHIKFSPVTSIPSSDEYHDPGFGMTDLDELRLEELAKVIKVELVDGK